MTTNETTDESGNAVNEEEQALKQALAEAENKARADFRCKQLLEAANESLSMLALPRAMEGWLLEQNIAKMQEARTALAAECGTALTYDFDRAVLSRAGRLIGVGIPETAIRMLDIVRAALPEYGQGGAQHSTLNMFVAIIDYALNRVIDDEQAKVHAEYDINPGNVLYPIELKLEKAAASVDAVALADVVREAEMEVSRLVWRYIAGKGENPMYIKHACATLCMALVATGCTGGPRLDVFKLHASIKHRY